MRDIEPYRAPPSGGPRRERWPASTRTSRASGRRCARTRDQGRSPVPSARRRAGLRQQAPPLAPSRHDAVPEVDRGRGARVVRRARGPKRWAELGSQVHRDVLAGGQLNCYASARLRARSDCSASPIRSQTASLMPGAQIRAVRLRCWKHDLEIAPQGAGTRRGPLRQDKFSPYLPFGIPTRRTGS